MRGLARKFETLNFNLLHFPVYRDRAELFFYLNLPVSSKLDLEDEIFRWTGVLLQTRPSFSPSTQIVE